MHQQTLNALRGFKVVPVDESVQQFHESVYGKPEGSALSSEQQLIRRAMGVS